jgi:hypothetical protein
MIRPALIALGISCATLTACGARNALTYRDETRKLLETKLVGLQACYDAELQRHPAAAGKVVVRFKISNETGQIVNPHVDDLASTPNRTLRGCVLDALKGLALDPPDARTGDATFTWEFQIAGS